MSNGTASLAATLALPPASEGPHRNESFKQWNITIKPNSVYFVFDGFRVDLNDTATRLGMEDGDILEAHDSCPPGSALDHTIHPIKRAVEHTSIVSNPLDRTNLLTSSLPELKYSVGFVPSDFDSSDFDSSDFDSSSLDFDPDINKPPDYSSSGGTDVQDFYTKKDFLGKGAYAIVHEVVDQRSGRVYARKDYYANRSDLDYIRWQFENEVNIMRSLSRHHHIVSFVDSYIKGQQFAIIVEPAAKPGSLATFLFGIKEKGRTTREERRILQRSFGCLASGLAFIHEKVVRLKDVKPDNILVHGEDVIYADFGVAFHASGLDTTTEGVPHGFSRRYCAPEIVEQTPRNRKSDIFSLGCVYCEILSILEPSALPPTMLKSCYAENIETIQQELTKVRNRAISEACFHMLERINDRRWNAKQVEHHLYTCSSPPDSIFCAECVDIIINRPTRAPTRVLELFSSEEKSRRID
ncbi:hypothetical protein DL770_005293 [Monosporascus sp. CRB-9-2]|nr:hypothetical protein DL770_005293 [Monosporascus sp. CRB-9-2]